MPNPKNFHAKPVSHVSFTDLDGPPPKKNEPEPPTYTQNAQNEASAANVGHDEFKHKPGKYIGTEFPESTGRIYKFLISKDINGIELIGDGNLLCLPCPDFCTGKRKSKNN